MAKTPASLEPLELLKTFSVFQVIFNNYLGRKCYFVSVPDWTWTVLFIRKQNTQQWNFEEFYGKTAERARHNKVQFQKMVRAKRSLVSRFGDSVEFYTPVYSGKTVKGFIISEGVLEKHPTPESFRRYWKELTGTEGSDLNPDFLYYARTILSQPLLNKEGIAGYSRLLELLAQWIAGLDRTGILQEAERLLNEVFSKQSPHPEWVNWMVGTDKFFVKPDKDRTVQPWFRHEIGITRMPNVAVALMPQKPLLHAGALDILCLNRRFQHECFLAARELEETYASPLGDYGSILLTSSRPGATPYQARLEIHDRVQKLCRILNRNLNVKIHAGVGSLVPPGGSLPKSYREAVLGLHSAVEGDQEIVSVNQPGPTSENPSEFQMQVLIRHLSESLARSSPAQLALARDNFIHKLLLMSYGPEVSRAYLLAALHLLTEQFEHRSGLNHASTRALGSEWMGRLESAVTLPDLVASFRESLDALLRYQDSPRDASSASKMENVVAEISKEPGRSWHLAKLSKQIGMSAPTFSKWFQKVAGLPFGPYLKKVRLEKAGALLREENMSLERIAQECGFSSASSFVQIFKRMKGVSPRRYHQKTEQSLKE
jgi:AraC-like DNA-binding protein